MPFVCLGEAAGEFTDVTGTDQLAYGRVTGWRHGPVFAGGAAAPDPPLRVLAPEPPEPGILVVPALAGGHGGRWGAAALQGAGGWGPDGRMCKAATSLAAGSAMPADWPRARRGRARRAARPRSSRSSPGWAVAEQISRSVTARSPSRSAAAPGADRVRRHRESRGPAGGGP